VLQGVLFQYFSLADIMWIVCLEFGAFISVVLPSYKHLIPKLFLYELCIITSIVAVYVVLAGSLQAYSYSGGEICVLTPSPSGSVWHGYDSWLYWMPLSTFCVIAVVLWVWIVITLLRRTTFSLKGILYSIRAQMRMMLFVAYFSFAIGSGIVYRMTQTPRSKTLAASSEAFLFCNWASVSFGSFGLPTQSCGTHPVPNTPLGYEAFNSVLGWLVPEVYFLLLCTVPDVRHFYGKLWNMLLQRDVSPAALVSLTRQSSTHVSVASHSQRPARESGDSFPQVPASSDTSETQQSPSDSQ